MAITPVALGVQIPQPYNPVEGYGNVLKLQSMQQQNALAETQMAELERQRSQNALLNEAYGRAVNPQTGALDYNALVSELARGGQGSLIPGIRKAESEGIEAQFKARGAEQKYALDFLDATRRQLTPGMSLESVLAISRATHKDPVMGRLLNQMGIDPARTEAETIAAFNAGRGDEHILAMAMGAEKFAEGIKMLDVGGEYRRQLPGGRVETTGIRKTLTPEQVAAGRRADRQFGLEREKFEYEKGKDKGKGADPSVSEQQASYNIKRVLDAATNVQDAISRTKGIDAPGVAEAFVSSVPFLDAASNIVAGWEGGADRQTVRSAQADMIDALLYLATGAAYNKEQLAGQRQAYLPAWSDKPSARRAKRDRLASLIEGGKIRAGKAWTPEMDAAMDSLLSSISGEAPKERPKNPATAANTPPKGITAEEWAAMTPQERALWK